MSKRLGWLKAAVCVLSLLPALDLWRVLRGMNADWIQAYDYPVFALGIAVTGAWAFIFLFLALACSPVQQLTRLRFPGELRRSIGLLAFFYCLLHLAFYFIVGQKWRLDYVWQDALLTKSRLPGWGALILLLPLAITSTDGMVRWLGGRAWKRLHLLVFPATALAIWHLQWTQADHGIGDFNATWKAVVTFAVLMALRAISWGMRLFKRRSAQT